MNRIMRKRSWKLAIGSGAIVYCVIGGFSCAASPGQTAPVDSSANVETQDTMRMSASLAARLASAAGGLAGRGDVWFVIDVNPPHDLAGWFTTEKAATDYFDSLPELMRTTQRVVGPFNTPDDYPGSQPSFRVACKEPWTEWCPDTIPQSLQAQAVTQGILRLSRIQGGQEVWSRQWREADVDAIILSRRAFNRYLAPYLVQVHGLERTTFLRDSLFGPD